jgi:hypothetical protein
MGTLIIKKGVRVWLEKLKRNGKEWWNETECCTKGFLTYPESDIITNISWFDWVGWPSTARPEDSKLKQLVLANLEFTFTFFDNTTFKH